MNLQNSKSGQGRNIIAIIVILFIFSFVSIVMYTIYTQFLTAITASGFYTGQAQITGDKFLDSFRTWDWLLVFLMVGSMIALGVSSFRVATSPIFFIATIIMGIFYGFIAYFFNFIFSQMVSDTTLTAATLFFPRTILICTNLHWVALIAIIISSITLYGKREKGQFLT